MISLIIELILKIFICKPKIDILNYKKVLASSSQTFLWQCVKPFFNSIYKKIWVKAQHAGLKAHKNV